MNAAIVKIVIAMDWCFTARQHKIAIPPGGSIGNPSLAIVIRQSRLVTIANEEKNKHNSYMRYNEHKQATTNNRCTLLP